MKKPYLFLTTILTLIIFYSCKSDSIDACTEDCSKCVILSSKRYNKDNSLSQEISYEHDDNFNITKNIETNYSKGSVYSTVITENENIYENKLLSKVTQRVNGQIKEVASYVYYSNGKLRRVETKDGNNNIYTIFEFNENSRNLYSYEKYAEIYETRYSYDSKNNELTKNHITNGVQDFSYISEYDADSKIIKQTYYESYPNTKPSTTISDFSYNAVNKLKEISYQYIGKINITKTVYVYNDKNLAVSIISYLNNVIKSQENREYDNNRLLNKVSASYDNSPFEVFQELSYHSNGKIKQQIQKVPESNQIVYISYSYNNIGNNIGFELLDKLKQTLSKTVSTYLCRK